MTDSLDAQSRLDLINYKLEKATSTIQEADLLASGKFYNAAVNRLYYSVYYAASALMLTVAIEAATHKGIKTMLSLKFIQPGIVEREYGKIYQQLYNCRQAGDYEDFVYYDIESYNNLRPLAVKFIDRIGSLMNQDI